MAIGGGKKSGGGGNRKGRWVTLGYLWEGDNSAKYAAQGRLDCLPADGNWDGRIFLYPNKGMKGQKNPADYKLTALVGGEEQQQSSSRSSNCAIGDKLLASKENIKCHLKKPRSPDDVPEGDVPF